MPKEIKRKHEGDESSPTVGEKISKRNSAVVKDDNVAMRQYKRSTLKVKAKRQIDFVYENDHRSQNSRSKLVSDANNNAQINANKLLGPDNSKRAKLKEKTNEKTKPGKKQKSLNNKDKLINQCNFDGIQVPVNSDEGELDYVDDVEQDDESCSIDHEDLAVTDKGEEVMELGATSSTLTEEQLIMNNPHLRKLLNKMLDERI